MLDDSWIHTIKPRMVNYKIFEIPSSALAILGLRSEGVHLDW